LSISPGEALPATIEAMTARRRTALAVEAERANAAQLATVGADVRRARLRRRLTQTQLGARTGLSRMAISRAERGHGGGMTLDAWQRIGIALGMPVFLNLRRDHLAETRDAAHLAMQELALRLGRAAGYEGTFELPTKPLDPVRSIDVGLIDDRRRRIIVDECWNTFGDIGAAARSSDRKAAEAEAFATARWGEEPHQVGLVWTVRATAANRALIGRYPEVFAARFPGSSAGWVAALTQGAPAPKEPGLIWCDVATTRLFPWRRSPRR
jgi:DNA-binding XRE family transcriptional regulator